jgi:hypothetical protein
MGNEKLLTPYAFQIRKSSIKQVLKQKENSFAAMLQTKGSCIFLLSECKVLAYSKVRI